MKPFQMPTFLSALAVAGSDRYRPIILSGDDPKYYFVVHDYPSLAEGTYWIWRLTQAWNKRIAARFGIVFEYGCGMLLPSGFVDDDEEILSMMAGTIQESNMEGTAGIGVSVGAKAYYHIEAGAYEGLFCPGIMDKRRLKRLYADWRERFPLVFLEEPLRKDDKDDYDFIRGGAAITDDAADSLWKHSAPDKNPRTLLIAGGRHLCREDDFVEKARAAGALDAVVLDLLPPLDEPLLLRLSTKIRSAKLKLFCDCGRGGVSAEAMVDLSLRLGSDLAYECGQGPFANRYLEAES
jgi:hypothetical protein